MADLLEITTLIERPTILIDKVKYEIQTPDDLSIVDYHRFERWGRRIDALMAQDELDAKNAAELKNMIINLTDRIMLDIPAEIRNKLSETMRLRVATVFTKLSLMTATPKSPKAPQRRGGKSSRGSRNSTAATPPAG